MAQKLVKLMLQSELAQNVIFPQSKSSTLEGIPAGMPNLEEEIVKTRWAVGEAKLILNETAPEEGLLKDDEFADFLEEDIGGVPPSSRTGPSNPWGGSSSSFPPSFGPAPQYV